MSNMPEILINGTDKREVLTAFKVLEKQAEYIVLLTEKFVDENRITESFFKKSGEDKFHSIPEDEWTNVKTDYYIMHCLRGQKEGVSYIEAPTNIVTEGKGNELALRKGNMDTISANYIKGLQELHTSVISEEPKQEEVVVASENIPIVEPIVTPAISEATEIVKNEAIDVNNMIYTEMKAPEGTNEEAIPIHDAVPQMDSVIVSQPEPSVAPTIEPALNLNSAFAPVSDSISTKQEESSKIMEAIQIPDNTIGVVQDLPPIVDMPKEDNIVNFSGVSTENVVNEEPSIPKIQENNEEYSPVEASYMDSFDKSIAQMEQATEKMQSAYEMMKSAYEQMNAAMNIVKETSENVKHVSHENFQQIQGMNAISRQTFENAQRMMNSQNTTEEPSLSRVA